MTSPFCLVLPLSTAEGVGVEKAASESDKRDELRGKKHKKHKRHKSKRRRNREKKDKDVSSESESGSKHQPR